MPLHCIALHCIALYCSVLYCIAFALHSNSMASARGHRMQGTEHDIAFSLALGCAIALHCIALHCIVAFQDTVQGWVYDRAFFQCWALPPFYKQNCVKKGTVCSEDGAG